MLKVTASEKCPFSCLFLISAAPPMSIFSISTANFRGQTSNFCLRNFDAFQSSEVGQVVVTVSNYFSEETRRKCLGSATAHKDPNEANVEKSIGIHHLIISCILVTFCKKIKSSSPLLVLPSLPSPIIRFAFRYTALTRVIFDLSNIPSSSSS